VALVATYLADKSALARMTHASVARRLTPLIADGEVATCGIVDLEVLYSARSERDLAETRARRAIAYPRVPMAEADFLRAEEVMALLAKSGRHRAAGIPDLLIAAVAERAGLTILHYDADYDVIAAVTRQTAEWVVPKGSL
jgi:predicted nucleic acid-binding protein